jgi:peptidoglycan/LPS O-acetylase OafA/YrhL
MQGKKFEQIDSLRFFAVFPVLLTHWGLFNIPGVIDFMASSNGVNLFFTISGFLITLGLLQAKEKKEAAHTSLWKFYARRFIRIFPLYYLMLLALWFFNHTKVQDGIWWYLSYSTNFYCIKIHDWGGLSHLWSLALEEQFYLVWPFVILFIPRRILLFVIAASIAFSIAAKCYWLNQGASFWTFYMNPLAVVDVLGFGALLAFFYCFHQHRLRLWLYNKPFTIIVIFQLLLIFGFKFSTHYAFIYDVLDRASLGLFAAWLIGRAVYGFTGIIGYILNARPLKYIGKISYGVYLLHILVPGMLLGLKYPENPALRFCLFLAVTIAICSLSWYGFESKILKLKNKLE